MSASAGVDPRFAIPARAMPLSRAVCAVVIVMAVSTAIVLAALVYRSSLRIPFNYNEGWNAFWASRVAMGGTLYPPQDAMVFNNYPPLSFLLVGGLSKFGVPVWVVGRMVSWVSFAGCAVLIQAVLRALGGARPASMLGAMLFAALMACAFNAYLGMYDPQLTAHCGMLVGLYVLVRAGAPTRRSVIIAALVIVASGFIKHNLVALPAAITAWLAITRRDLLAAWLLAGAAGLAVGFVLCQAAFGADFLAGLATPRAWAWHNLASKLLLWMPPIGLVVLLVVGLVPRLADDPAGVLLWLFVVLGIASGCVGLAGDGVAFNALFELVIATCLALGHLLGRARLSAWLALGAVAMVAWSTAVAAAAVIHNRYAWFASLDQRAASASRGVALIAAQPGPALCEDLLLCYWAGKSFEVDVFNYAQAVRAGTRGPGALLARIERGEFGAIQLNEADNRMPARFQAAMRERYDPVVGAPGVYLRRQSRE
jgi:hypothetical protein